MRIVLGSIAALALIAIIIAIAAQIAIARNGPAVLSAIDRLVGGARGASLAATLSTGPEASQKLIIWAPDEPAASSEQTGLPVILFVHGGSWRTGDPADYDFMARALVARGFVVALAGYRLVPDGGVYPAMLEDTAAAIAITHDTVTRYGGDPESIVIAGHSAGAYNVVMTTLDRRWLQHHGIEPSATKGPIKGVFAMSGPYDFYPFTSDSTKAAFGAAPDPEATQIEPYIRGDAPEIFALHGGKDDLVSPANSLSLAKQITAAGGKASSFIVPEMWHNDPLIAFAAPWRSRRDITDRLADFAQRVTSGRKSEGAGE